MYPREQYLKEIISKKDNGRIKIITGLRRSGKSVLPLNTITPIWGFAMQGSGLGNWKRLTSWKMYCTMISSGEE